MYILMLTFKLTYKLSGGHVTSLYIRMSHVKFLALMLLICIYNAGLSVVVSLFFFQKEPVLSFYFSYEAPRFWKLHLTLRFHWKYTLKLCI